MFSFRNAKISRKMIVLSNTSNRMLVLTVLIIQHICQVMSHVPPIFEHPGEDTGAEIILNGSVNSEYSAGETYRTGTGKTYIIECRITISNRQYRDDYLREEILSLENLISRETVDAMPCQLGNDPKELRSCAVYFNLTLQHEELAKLQCCAEKHHKCEDIRIHVSGGPMTEGCESTQYLEMGKQGTIQCWFRQPFFMVVWRAPAEDDSIPSTLILRDGQLSGAGYESGEYNVCLNGSLIINKVSLKHEMNFRVLKFESVESLPLDVTVHVITTVLPDVPFPVVSGCMEYPYCVLIVDREGTMSCLVKGIRPTVDLRWETSLPQESEMIEFSDAPLKVTENADGETYNVLLTTNYSIKPQHDDRLMIKCIASGPTKLHKSFQTIDLTINDGPQVTPISSPPALISSDLHAELNTELSNNDTWQTGTSTKWSIISTASSAVVVLCLVVLTGFIYFKRQRRSDYQSASTGQDDGQEMS